MKKIFTLICVCGLALMGCEEYVLGPDLPGRILEGEYLHCVQAQSSTEGGAGANYCEGFSFQNNFQGTTIKEGDIVVPISYYFDSEKIIITQANDAQYLLDDEIWVSNDRKTLTWLLFENGESKGKIELLLKTDIP